MSITASTTLSEDGRRHRADGNRSRAAILAAAAELATVEGINGLSIGRLAEYVGMSKSGVFAHFRSKEELQLAAIDTAREIYDREVTEPGLASPEGVAQVYGLCEAFLSHVERGVFPGGCFFVSVASELDAKDGPVKDHVREVFAELVGDLARVIRRAQELGELDSSADPAQILFELDSFLLGANTAFVFFGDREAPDRARAAIRDALERLAPR